MNRSKFHWISFMVSTLLQICTAETEEALEINCVQLQNTNDLFNFTLQYTHLTIKDCNGSKLNLTELDVKKVTLQAFNTTSVSSIAINRMLEKLEVVDSFLTHFENGVLSNTTTLKSLTFQNTKLKFPSEILQQATSLTSLEITDSLSLENIDDNLLKPLISLVSLTLRNNKIKQISPNAFQSLNKLVILHVINCTQDLDTRAFSGLYNLGLLNLQRNHLQQVPALEQLSNLQFLHLDHNAITAIFKEDFGKHLVNLQKLSMANNLLSQLSGRLFQNLTLLYWLDLSFNLIQEIDPEVFIGLIKLKHLTLSGNKINDIDKNAFKDLRSVVHLQLDHNNISSLSPELFVNTKKLHNLSLANNKINSLPKNIFSNLTILGSLDLQNNEITAIPDGAFRNLVSLRYLYLQNNKVSKLEKNLFADLKSVRYLWLTNNLLGYLDSESFKGLISLTNLYLNDNEITRVDSDVFKTNTNLATIILTNNKLIKLNSSITRGLYKLKMFKIDVNVTQYTQ